ncbi:7TM-DISM domain-containing protein, partial [Alcanivorax jadensis]
MTKGTVSAGRLAALICALFLSLNSNALTLTDHRDSYQAAAGMQWLADQDHSLSPTMALQALRAGKGQPLDTAYPSLGFRNGFQWFLIAVENNSTMPYWFLRVGRP